MLTCLRVLPLLALPISALAQEPEVRLWTPYDDGSQAFECISADLSDWLSGETQEGTQVPIAHRLIDLPEGRYLDQVAAASDTGELPDLLLGSVAVLSVLQDLDEGPLFGADLIGLWVNEDQLASLPTAEADAATMWQGNGAVNLSVFDEVLSLLQSQGHLGFGLDIGASGEDLGLGLALLITQWSLTFDSPDMPDWQEPSLLETLEILGRWQQRGLMREVNLTSELGEQAVFTLGPYSAGQNLDADYRFYPLFAGVAGKGPAFLELDITWFPTRPSAVPLYGDIYDSIARGEVFNTCAETAGLLSYQQFADLRGDDFMNIFGPRRGTAIGADADVDIETWTGLQPELPGALTNVLRDMRAGLSIANALEGLESQLR